MKPQASKICLLATAVIGMWTLGPRSADAQTATLSAAASTAPSTLTVYVYPSYTPLNWNTPHGLLSSFVDMAAIRSLHLNKDVTFTSDFGDAGTLSSYYVSTMGHSVNHIDCALADGSRYDRWVSFAGDEIGSVDVKNIVTNQIGMGMLFYEFVDGYIMSGAENTLRLIYNKNQQGNPRYLQFEFDSAQCQKVKDMVSTFESYYYKPGTSVAALTARGPAKTLYFDTQDAFDSYENHLKDPNSVLGGRCISFSAGLVKMIGQFDPSFDSWLRNKDISENLIGIDAQGKAVKKVSPLSILFGSLSQNWQYPGVANRPLSLYDPQLLWNFIGDLESCVGGQNCSADAEGFLSRHKAMVGPTQTFSHTVASCGTSVLEADLTTSEDQSNCTQSVGISGVQVH